MEDSPGAELRDGKIESKAVILNKTLKAGGKEQAHYLCEDVLDKNCD